MRRASIKGGSMKHETDLIITLVCCAFVVGFGFGMCVAKWALRNVIRKYEMVFGKIKDPVIDIL